MSAGSPIALGIYFIDVLACLLFALTLALVDARFGSETTVSVDLPDLAAGAGPGGALESTEVLLRESPEGVEAFLDGEPLALAALLHRLDEAPPLSLVVRAEQTPVTQVIGAAHAAGVREIEIAYEAVEEDAR